MKIRVADQVEELVPRRLVARHVTETENRIVRHDEHALRIHVTRETRRGDVVHVAFERERSRGRDAREKRIALPIPRCLRVARFRKLASDDDVHRFARMKFVDRSVDVEPRGACDVRRGFGGLEIELRDARGERARTTVEERHLVAVKNDAHAIAHAERSERSEEMLHGAHLEGVARDRGRQLRPLHTKRFERTNDSVSLDSNRPVFAHELERGRFSAV